MTPLDYLNEIVIPTLQEFEQNRTSRRHAYLACITVFHIKDHLNAAGVTSVVATTRANASPAFEVVRSICNGTKHAVTDNSHKIEFRIGDDYERPPAFAGVMVCGLSYVGDTDGGREIRHRNQGADIYFACHGTIELFKQNFPTHFTEIDAVKAS